ncbi:MAG: hypothetical protein ACOH2M_03905 [Cypionkella sp.]
MDNLERSELVIAKILGLLVEWGLSETSMEFSELELDDEYLPFFATCIEWLEAEGVIRVKRVHKFLDGTSRIQGPVLTARGISLMGNQIKVGNTDVTVGNAVKETAKHTNYYTGLGDIGGGFVGGLFKSLGSG